MQERLIHFDLFGQEFTFYTDVSDEDVASVIALVRAELERDQRMGLGAVPSSKILVLGCLRLASRLVQVQREHEAYRRCEERTAGQLADKVFAQLE